MAITDDIRRHADTLAGQRLISILSEYCHLSQADNPASPKIAHLARFIAANGEDWDAARGAIEELSAVSARPPTLHHFRPAYLKRRRATGAGNLPDCHECRNTGVVFVVHCCEKGRTIFIEAPYPTRDAYSSVCPCRCERGRLKQGEFGWSNDQADAVYRRRQPDRTAAVELIRECARMAERGQS